MSISDHVRNTRQPMRIVTSDPSTNRIEGVGQDQAVVQIAMHTKQTITRWPVEGEIWMVERRNGTPYLDALMTPAEEESFSINDMEPGQARINADSVVDQDGKPFIVLSGDLIDQYYVQYDENRGFVLSPVEGEGVVDDATTTSKGIIQLAGDLAGTAASPQIAPGVITNAEISSSAAISFSKLGAPTAAFSFDGQRITNLGAPTNSTDAATRSYVDTKVYTDADSSTKGIIQLTNDLGGTAALPQVVNIHPSGDISMSSHKITSLATPTNSTDAATKQYVDSLVTDPNTQVVNVRVYSININTTSAPSTVDGITLSNGDWILNVSGSLAACGVWVFNGSGNALTRPTGYTSSTGKLFFVTSGTTYAGSYIARDGTNGIAPTILARRISDSGTARWEITDLKTPSASTDAATKGYVDASVTSALGGANYQKVVHTASKVNITVSSPGATIGGYTPSNGDRILLAQQSTQSENGIYIFNGSSSALTRATDSDSVSEMPNAVHAYVINGTWAGTTFVGIGTYGSNMIWANQLFVGQNWQFSVNDSTNTFFLVSGTSGGDYLSINSTLFDIAVSGNNRRIAHVTDPASAQDAATKNYVDTGDTNAKARANHTGTQTASTISDFDTQVRTSRLDQMAAPTTDVSLNTHKITNVVDPTSAQDAATKNYVDTHSGSGSVSDAPIIVPLSAASSYTFSGLDGDTDELYELVAAGTLSGSAQVYIQFNGATSTYYSTEVYAAGGANPLGSAPTKNGIAIADANFQLETTVRLSVKSGKPRTARANASYGMNTTTAGVLEHGGHWTTTTGNVTSITINFDGSTFTGTLILRKVMSPSTVVPGPRIVRGSVNSAGTIVRGSGYTVTKNGTGDYTINFTTPFAATPVVNLTSQSWTAILRPDLTPYSASQIRLQCFNTTTGAAIDGGFDFEAIDTSGAGVASWSAPMRVTSLPASQPDGTEIYFQPDPSGQPEVLWHMRYDATAAKWDFLGGSPLIAETTTNVGSITSSSYVSSASLATLPSLTVSTAGTYSIEIYSAAFYVAVTNATARMAVRLGTAAVSDSESFGVYGSASQIQGPASVTLRRTVAASSVLQLYALTNSPTLYPNGGGNYALGLRVLPVRIG